MNHVQLVKCQLCPLRNILVSKSKLSEPTHDTWPAGWETQPSSSSSPNAGMRVKCINLGQLSELIEIFRSRQIPLSGTILPALPPTDPSTVMFNFAFNKFDKDYKDKYLSHWSFTVSTDRFWGSSKAARTWSWYSTFIYDEVLRHSGIFCVIHISRDEILTVKYAVTVFGICMERLRKIMKTLIMITGVLAEIWTRNLRIRSDAWWTSDNSRERIYRISANNDL
jgi:hypothetical protein